MSPLQLDKTMMSHMPTLDDATEPTPWGEYLSTINYIRVIAHVFIPSLCIMSFISAQTSKPVSRWALVRV